MRKFLKLGQPLGPVELIGKFYKNDEEGAKHVLGTSLRFTVEQYLGERRVDSPLTGMPSGRELNFRVRLLRSREVLFLNLRQSHASVGAFLRDVWRKRPEAIFEATTKRFRNSHGEFYTWDLHVPAPEAAHPNCRCVGLTPNGDYYQTVADRLGISRDKAKADHWAKTYGAANLLGTLVNQNAYQKEKGRMKPNRFFVITEGNFASALGFVDLKQAAAYATEKTKDDGRERSILQKVRVVRRKPQPVVVEKV